MKKNTKKWVVITLGVLGLAMVYGNSKTAASIVDWSMISSNIMKLVVRSPDIPARYQVKKTDELTNTNWVDVAHADAVDGSYVTTNLSYSTTETNGDTVIYVKTDDKKGFFKINYEP